MRIESAQPLLSNTGKNDRRALMLILALHFIAALASNFPTPAAAQQGWAPTVATSPGRTFDAPDPFQTGAVQVPPVIDPNMFPSPRTAPQVRPQPQKVWSPIVTGAIPDPRDRDRAPVTGATRPRTIPGHPAGAGEVQQTPLKVLAVGDQKTAPLAPAAKAAPTAPANTGAEGTAAPAAEAIFKKPGPLDAPPPNANGAQQYCFNTVDTAADARFAWQAKKIRDMEAELDKRAQQLEAKTEEYKSWLARRDEFARKAHEKLVGFYSRMRPDAAAAQLATVDEEMAAAVVTKLETKVASQIMGEMEPERAAKIATIISGAAKIPPSRKPPAAAPPDNKPPDASGAGAPTGAPRS